MMYLLQHLIWLLYQKINHKNVITENFSCQILKNAFAEGFIRLRIYIQLKVIVFLV